jgi:voltage-gated potassium channel Kch
METGADEGKSKREVAEGIFKRLRAQDQLERQIKRAISKADPHSVRSHACIALWLVVGFCGTMLLLSRSVERLVRGEFDSVGFSLSAYVLVGFVTAFCLRTFWLVMKEIAGRKLASRGARIWWVSQLFMVVALLLLTFATAYIACGIVYASTTSRVLSVEDAIYFSAVTMLTVGYGDILPIGWSKGLVVVQPTIGVLLFGMLVAAFGYLLDNPRPLPDFREDLREYAEEHGLSDAEEAAILDDLKRQFGKRYFGDGTPLQ